MTNYIKMALRAELAQENTSQVAQRAIVHAYDGSNPNATMCGQHYVFQTEEVDQKRVVSCAQCRDALLAASRTEEFAKADRDLIVALRMRATLFPHPASYLAGLLRQTARQLERRLQRIESGNPLPDDTSVPQAQNTALTPPNDGFNCALCEDTGKRFGKRCECAAAAVGGLLNAEAQRTAKLLGSGVFVRAAHAIAAYPFERVTPLEREVRNGIVLDGVLTSCAAGKDGECAHKHCPQLRDNEPHKSGRHCPLDTNSDE